MVCVRACVRAYMCVSDNLYCRDWCVESRYHDRLDSIKLFLSDTGGGRNGTKVKGCNGRGRNGVMGLNFEATFGLLATPRCSN